VRLAVVRGVSFLGPCRTVGILPAFLFSVAQALLPELFSVLHKAPNTRTVCAVAAVFRLRVFRLFLNQTQI